MRDDLLFTVAIARWLKRTGIGHGITMDFGESKLVNVVRTSGPDGEEATATVTGPDGEDLLGEPLEFVKAKQGWLLRLPL